MLEALTVLVVLAVVLAIAVTANGRTASHPSSTRPADRPAPARGRADGPRDRPSDAPRSVAVPPAPPADGAPLEPVAIRLEPLPQGIAAVHTLSSFSRPGDEYTCDLAAQTCTCGDFRTRRRHFPVGDFARLCKHLRTLARTHRMITVADPALADRLNDVWGDRVLRGAMQAGDVVYLAYTFDGECINVLAKERRAGDPLGAHSGPYAHFGFSDARNGWSYGAGPEGAREVRRMVKTALWYQAREAATLPRALVEAIAADARRDAEEQERAQAAREAAFAQEDAERRRHPPCYVCQHPLSGPEHPSVGVTLVCARCEIANVVTTASGGTNRPERLSIYRRYDGDRRSGERGLVGELEVRFEAEVAALKAEKAAGQVTDAEYRSRRAKLTRNRDAEAARIEAAKRAELDPLLAEEKAITRRLTGPKARGKRTVAGATPPGAGAGA